MCIVGLLISGGIIGLKYAHTFLQRPLSDCKASDYRCYAEYFAKKTYHSSPEEAFTELKAAYEKDTYVQSQCHQLTHIIGRTGYKKYGSLSGAYKHGDSFCWSGFHHGAVEQAIGDVGAVGIKKQANGICKELADARRYSFDHFNCVHGLGHGFMSIDGYELPTALKSCQLLTDSWEAESCYGGVFMENVMVATRENGYSKYLNKDDLLYPCNGIERQFRQQCYMMQSSYMLQQNGYNFGATFALCAQADSEFVATCYQSIGRDASGSTVSDVALTKQKCSSAPNGDALYNCMIGAVKDFVSYFHGTAQAEQLCQAFGGEIVAPCKQTISDYYAVF